MHAHNVDEQHSRLLKGGQKVVQGAGQCSWGKELPPVIEALWPETDCRDKWQVQQCRHDMGGLGGGEREYFVTARAMHSRQRPAAAAGGSGRSNEVGRRAMLQKRKS